MTRHAQNRIRCVLGMLGTDVHNKGIRSIARILRDHGVEVIYLGEHNTCERLVAAVVSEDADLVGLSFSTAGYRHHIGQFMATMKLNGLDDVPVMVGGLIHADDEPALRADGVAAIFGPGTTTQHILDFVHTTSSVLDAAEVLRPKRSC
jgi:methylmalonyl-CoA mutase, C-terminal domain